MSEFAQRISQELARRKTRIAEAVRKLGRQGARVEETVHGTQLSPELIESIRETREQISDMAKNAKAREATQDEILPQEQIPLATVAPSAREDQPPEMPEPPDPFQRELTSHKEFLKWLSSDKEASWEWQHIGRRYEYEVASLGYSCEREFITMIATGFRKTQVIQSRLADEMLFEDRPLWLLKEMARRRKLLWQAIRDRQPDLDKLDLSRFTNGELISILEGKPVPKIPTRDEIAQQQIADRTAPWSKQIKERAQREGRDVNLATSFEERLRAQKLHMPFVRARGQPALWYTQESIDTSLVEQIKTAEQYPNGYLIGIGCGGAFLHLEWFRDEVPPKAIILADIDPMVVLFGKALVEALKVLRTEEEFVREFLGWHGTGVERFMTYVEARDPYGPTLANVIRDTYYRKDHEIEEIIKNSYMFHGMFDPEMRKMLGEIREYEKKKLHKIAFPFMRHFDLLQRLAREGNLAMVHADFTHSGFLMEAADLPEFRQLRSVIYLSNIVDHVTDKGRDLRGLGKMSRIGHFLHWHSQGSYITDCLAKEGYKIRMSTEFPRYHPDQLMRT